MKKEYWQIGSVVDFIRVKDNELVEGRGVINTIFIMPDSHRLTAQIKIDGSTAFNVDYVCVNPTDAVKESLLVMHQEANSLTDEGNAKVREIVGGYNEKVEAIYTALLGEPLTISLDEVDQLAENKEEKADSKPAAEKL